MKNVKYTPGPWNLDPKKDWDKVIRVEQKGDGWQRLYVEVCRDDCDTEMAEANARLISAAPDLLKALKDAFEAATLLRSQCTTGTDVADVLDSFIPATRAAIAKAEGKVRSS